MMRSMYSGVAGLKTHQTKMDVIGNNIANVNTVAYKSQSVTFSELMYQTTQNASGANALTGTAGINARQIGLGVKMGAINTAISTEGATQTTNNPFDIRITGDSFFIVSNGTDTFFTRDGSFYVDGAGNLAMTSNGYNVMGWQVDPETMDIKKETVSALRVMSPENMTYPPEATTKAYVAGILDQNDTDVNSSSGKTMNLQFYDNLGYSYTAKMIIRDAGQVEGADTRKYTVELSKILDSNNEEIDIEQVAFGGGTNVEGDYTTGIKSSQYEWNTSGELINIVDTANNPLYTMGTAPSADQWNIIATAYNVDPTDANELATFKSSSIKKDINGDGTIETITFDQLLTNAQVGTDAGGNPITALTAVYGNNSAENLKSIPFNAKKLFGTVELTFDAKTGKFNAIDGGDSVTLALSAIDPDGRFADIQVDFTNTTMYNNAGVSTITATNGDTKGLGSGRKLGQMSGISISNDGRIYASYDNGQSKLLGQIAVAQFSNASGLEKDGDNLYKATQNSGAFDGIGQDIMADGGYMTTGVLEMSNVDLSSEFTEMITTQRGFQANSRIITVSDTLLEELINLKR